MLRATYLSISLFISIIIIPGCSGSGAGTVTPDPIENPVPQGPAVEQTPDLTTQSRQSGPTHQMWGYYDLYFDFEKGTVEAVVNRDVMFEVNVVTFINQSPANLSFEIVEIINDVDHVDVDINVGLKHPFSGLPQYNGYDVRGVFIGAGSSKFDSNQLNYPDPGLDQVMIDDPDVKDGGSPDGYTRWYNPDEFSTGGEGLFGYTVGTASTKGFAASSNINPYKLFADGLTHHESAYDFVSTGDGAGNNVFSSGSTNWRNYYIRFPMPNPGVAYNYAVVASWGGEDPEFHPTNTTEVVASKSDHGGSTVYYLDASKWGGTFRMNLDLAGYGPQPDMINIESEIFSSVLTFSADTVKSGTGGATWSAYQFEIPADSVDRNGLVDVWFKLDYFEHDYENEYGVNNTTGGDYLSAYFKSTLNVLDYVPAWIEVIAPNGGEEFVPGSSTDILWDSYEVTGPVRILYSKDNFVNDINEIATDEVNDGTYTWADIPFDPSDTVKIQVSSLLDPTVFDRSDDYFSILEPSITVTSPNGGEAWKIESNHDITWTSQYHTGTVNIEYSFDDFVSDVRVLAANVPDSGSWTWTNIPCEPSETVLVRVLSNQFPGIVGDQSDDYFAIEGAGKVNTYGYAYRDEGWVVESDDDGNVYVTGLITQFGTNTQVFLSKYDSCGDLEWGVIWGGADYDYGSGLALDDQGNVYVIGGFENWADFDPGIGVDGRFSNGYIDVFLVKYNSSGQYQWARTWGGSFTDGGYGLAYDDVNNYLYVCGDFHFTVDFDPGAGNTSRTSLGTYDIWLSKFTSSGTFQWVQTWGSTQEDYCYGVDTDSSGNPYITGNYLGTMDFNPGPGTVNHTPTGKNDIYLIKLSSAGGYVWSSTIGGAGTDSGHRIGVDGSSVYVTGYFSDTVDFDPTASTDFKSSAGDVDVFLSKYSTTGSYIWTEKWGSTAEDIGYGLTIDGDGDLYVVGAFRGTVDFDPGGASDYETSNGLNDVFLNKLDSTGTQQWVRAWGSSLSDYGYDIAVDGHNIIYTTGLFQSSCDFAPTNAPCNEPSSVKVSAGNTDVFLTKHLPDGCW